MGVTSVKKNRARFLAHIRVFFDWRLTLTLLHLCCDIKMPVTVHLGVPVLLEGTKDYALVRFLVEVAAWADGLVATIENFLSSTRRVVQLCTKNLGTGKTVQVQKQLCQLPVSLTSFGKKTFVSDGWADIFERVLPLNSGSENDY
jgi:hypothetical protein